MRCFTLVISFSNKYNSFLFYVCLKVIMNILHGVGYQTSSVTTNPEKHKGFGHRKTPNALPYNFNSTISCAGVQLLHTRPLFPLMKGPTAVGVESLLELSLLW